MLGLDLGFIFSHLTTEHAFAIEDVNIRTISLETRQEDVRYAPNLPSFSGCSPMVSDENSLLQTPIYYCEAYEILELTDNFINYNKSHVRFLFYSNSQALNISKFSKLIFKVELQNDRWQPLYSVSLTHVGYSLNHEKLTWMRKRIAKFCEIWDERLNVTVFNSTFR